MLVAGLALAACGTDDGSETSATTTVVVSTTEPPRTTVPTTASPTTASPTTVPPSTQAPPTTAPPTTTPAITATTAATTTATTTEPGAGGGTTGDERLDYAEGLIDAFYTFDATALAAAMGDVEGSDFVTFYQGWAEGGRYEVLERSPCALEGDTVSCDITVEDDFVPALGIDFNVTDTFHVRLDTAGEPVEIWTTSNDPEEMWTAFDWVFANKPELFEAECTGFFMDGPTPGACAEAFVAALTEYAETSSGG